MGWGNEESGSGLMEKKKGKVVNMLRWCLFQVDDRTCRLGRSLRVTSWDSEAGFVTSHTKINLEWNSKKGLQRFLLVYAIFDLNICKRHHWASIKTPLEPSETIPSLGSREMLEETAIYFFSRYKGRTQLPHSLTEPRTLDLNKWKGTSHPSFISAFIEKLLWFFDHTAA